MTIVMHVIILIYIGHVIFQILIILEKFIVSEKVIVLY